MRKVPFTSKSKVMNKADIEKPPKKNNILQTTGLQVVNIWKGKDQTRLKKSLWRQSSFMLTVQH